MTSWQGFPNHNSGIRCSSEIILTDQKSSAESIKQTQFNDIKFMKIRFCISFAHPYRIGYRKSHRMSFECRIMWIIFQLGLRTLCIAQRKLSAEEFEEIDSQLNSARNSLDDREEQVSMTLFYVWSEVDLNVCVALTLV